MREGRTSLAPISSMAESRGPRAGPGLRCSVPGPRRQTGSGAGYQVPGAR